MRFIVSDSHFAPFNIATEEYILHNIPEDVFLLYMNSPSIIVGIHQNTIAEINRDYVREHNIPVVRRLTGGGTVFHDLGNLNFSFIVTDETDKLHTFAKYTRPVLEVLNSLGVEARLEGRNDLTIKGMKFSGNAKAIIGGRILQHGTILFESRINDLAKALKANPLKFKDKAVKSIRARVTNVSEHLSQTLSMQQFICLIHERLRELYPDAASYQFPPAEKDAISELSKNKYESWDWNYGHSPAYSKHRGIRTNAGTIEVWLEVEQGRISGIRFYGDYFGKRDSSDLEKALTGALHQEEALREILNSMALNDFFGEVEIEDILGMLF